MKDVLVNKGDYLLSPLDTSLLSVTSIIGDIWVPRSSSLSTQGFAFLTSRNVLSTLH
jgi:hypothetical protein